MNTIIEKIRAEVERRKKQMVDASYPPVIKKTRISELSIVLDILDDIQERTDNPIIFTLQERPVKIDIRKELESIEFMGVNDARDSETIARHFYELGKQSKQPACEGEEEEYEQIKQKVCSDCPSHKDDYCGYVKRKLQRKCNYLSDVMYGYELGRQSKPKVSEGLEEEIDRLWNSFADEMEGPHNIFDVYARLARHFAQWGAEHRGSSETPKDLEEAAVEYSAIGYSPFDDPYEKNQWFECSKFAFIAGAKWQKEQTEKRWLEDRDGCFWDGVEEGKKAMREQMMKEANKALESCDKNTASYKDAFFAGVDWKEREMMKEAVEATVVSDPDAHGADYGLQKLEFAYRVLETKGIPNGRKVRIVIVKED